MNITVNTRYDKVQGLCFMDDLSMEIIQSKDNYLLLAENILYKISRLNNLKIICYQGEEFYADLAFSESTLFPVIIDRAISVSKVLFPKTSYLFKVSEEAYHKQSHTITGLSASVNYKNPMDMTLSLHILVHVFKQMVILSLANGCRPGVIQDIRYFSVMDLATGFRNPTAKGTFLFIF